MNLCSKCKNELPAEARYCNACGAPQIKTQPAVSTSTSQASETVSDEPRTTSDGQQKPSQASSTPIRTVRPTIKYTARPANARDILTSLAPTKASPTSTSSTEDTNLPEVSSQAEATQPPAEIDQSKPSEQSLAFKGARPSVASKVSTRKVPLQGKVHIPKSPSSPGVLKSLIWTEASGARVPIDISKPESSSETATSVSQADLPQSTIQPGISRPPIQHAMKNPAIKTDTLEQEQDVKDDSISSQMPTHPVTPHPRPGLIRPVGPRPIPRRFTNPGAASSSEARIPKLPEASTIPDYLKALRTQKPPSSLPDQQSNRPNSASVATAAQNGFQASEQMMPKEPVISTEQVQAENVQLPLSDSVVHNSTMPTLKTFSVEDFAIEQQATGHFPIANGHNESDLISAQATLEYSPLPEAHDEANLISAQATLEYLSPLHSPESMAATSRDAEHWRKSWYERQHSELAPAAEVSRGQASVPSPLLSMQQTSGHVRAILADKQISKQSTNFSFWVTLFLMICLIGGLGVYIISTYIPGTPLDAAHIAAPVNNYSPTLSIVGSQTATLAPGQMLHLHGDYFAANDLITFLLDTTTPILNKSDQPLRVQTSTRGTFDVVIPIGTDWTPGAHLISAEDSRTKQSVYLNIEVGLAGTPVRTSSELGLSSNGQPLEELTFQAVFGQGNPPQQRITLTNTSGAKLQWTATAIADQNLSWLVIDDNHTDGTLDISGTDTIGISVLVTGLQSSDKPYTGQIVFILNGKEQLTLPVELQLRDASAEMVFSPNPILAYEGPGETCKAGTTLTLINLGMMVITWAANPDNNAKNHIQFFSLARGQLTQGGQLEPSGQNGDTIVLSLKCTGVQVGDKYSVTVYANNAHWNASIFIQA